MLTIAVIIDRDHGRDLDKLIVGLRNESELITHHANPCVEDASGGVAVGAGHGVDRRPVGASQARHDAI
jgi:hypothetical protein